MPPTAVPSSTWFSQDPQWTWWIIVYFFIGGLAAGAYVTAAIVDLVGSESDQRFTRAGYLVAFPLTVIGGLCLTLDLGRPERFWHMLVASETLQPLLKTWSPISLGSWILTLIGLFTGISFVRVLLDRNWLPIRPLQALSAWFRRNPLDQLYHLAGIVVGLAMAAYPGVLLAATNRPLWGDTTLLGAIFVASSAASGAASIELVNLLAGRHDRGAQRRLTRFEQFAIVVTLVALASMVATIGGVAVVFGSLNGVLLGVGVVCLGLIVPFILGWRPSLMGASTLLVAAVLELAGGLLLRYVIVMANAGVTAVTGGG